MKKKYIKNVLRNKAFIPAIFYCRPKCTFAPIRDLETIFIEAIEDPLEIRGRQFDFCKRFPLSWYLPRRRKTVSIHQLLAFLYKRYNVSIDFAATVTYLGVILDGKLNIRSHVDQIRGKASRCMSALYPLIGRRYTLSANNKLRIFKMIIRPILTYASPFGFARRFLTVNTSRSSRTNV